MQTAPLPGLSSDVQPGKELRGLVSWHKEPWPLSSTVSVGQLTVFWKSERMSLEMSRSHIHRLVKVSDGSFVC